jgi:hypothetical protein
MNTTERDKLIHAAEELNLIMGLKPPIPLDGKYSELSEWLQLVVDLELLVPNEDELTAATARTLRLFGYIHPQENIIVPKEPSLKRTKFKEDTDITPEKIIQDNEDKPVEIKEPEVVKKPTPRELYNARIEAIEHGKHGYLNGKIQSNKGGNPFPGAVKGDVVTHIFPEK